MLLFKFPHNEKIFTSDETSENSSVSCISFDECEKIEFNGKIKETSIDDLPTKTTEKLLSRIENLPEESEEEYLRKISEVIEFIKENSLKKLVISRQKILDYSNISDEKKINLTKTFLNLCKSYPNAFTYLFIENSCWMGAFSEVLGKFNKETSEFETMSLAGTLTVEEDWTKKEIDEQKPVTEYIRSILHKYSLENKVRESETYNHISGNIKHLRTDFKTRINPDDLVDIISELHPTPAVCGIPKDFCKKAILDFERNPRHFYSGYIKVETEDFIQFFVNLRCAEFTKNAARIFVGGGITSESSPEKEWRETELKSQAILKNIAP